MFEIVLKQLANEPQKLAPKEKKHDASVRIFMMLLPWRKCLGNTAFRRKVIEAIMVETSSTQGASSMHYHRAFDQIKEHSPELVEGLGRAKHPRKRVVTILDRSRYIITVTAIYWS